MSSEPDALLLARVVRTREALADCDIPFAESLLADLEADLLAAKEEADGGPA